MVHSYMIALGSNLEPRSSYIEDAIFLIGELCGRVVAVSSLIETDPIGYADEIFLNGALHLESALAPLSLLEELNAIETSLGRTRNIRWGNRTIDLDIILWQNRSKVQTFQHENLQIPHPRALQRDFVMLPLCEIGPDWLWPEREKKVRPLCQKAGFLTT